MKRKVTKNFQKLLEDNGCDCVVRFAATVTTADKEFVDVFLNHMRDKLTHAKGCGYRMSED